MMSARLWLIVTIVGVGVGCGAAGVVMPRPLVAEDRRPEGRDLPPSADAESLPEGVSTELPENYVEPMEAGSCVSADDTHLARGPCPSWSGIAVSEARAARDAIYRIRYRELRQLYESDRLVWAAHRELYEAQRQRDREELDRLQPSWFEEHDLEIGIAAGFVFGAAIVVAITWAVEEVTSR